MQSLKQIWQIYLDQGKEVENRGVALWSGGRIIATLSTQGLPELIIQVQDSIGDSKDLSSSKMVRVNGMAMSLASLNINSHPSLCIVISPTLPKYNEVFFALAEHLVESLSKNLDLAPTSSTVDFAVQEWIDFFKKSPELASKERILGLIGELLAIRDWLDCSNPTFASWTGPEGKPQDFQGEKDQLEVKVLGTRTGPTVHRISSLLQLNQPADGKLSVLSFRVTLSAQGSQSLKELVEDVGSMQIFSSVEGNGYFWSAVEGLGYSDDIPAKFSRFDVVEAALYDVSDGFPSLKPEILNGLPSITDVTYNLDFSGLESFKVANSPIELRLS